MKLMTMEETEKGRAYLESSTGNYKYQGILQRGMSEEDRAQAIALMKYLGYLRNSKSQEKKIVNPSTCNYKYQGTLQRGMSEEDRAQAIALMKYLGYLRNSKSQENKIVNPSTCSRKAASKETATPLGSLRWSRL